MANVIEYLLKLNDQMSGKLGKINAGLSDMQSRVSGSLRNLGGPFDDIANKIDDIPIGLAAVGAAAGGLALVGKAALDAAANVQQMALAYDKLAQKTGASVEFLSGFTEAADDVGISSEAVNTALVKFSDNLFTLQGPSANVQASLMALADQFAKMPDGPAKTAIAINNFGKAGAEMIPILNQGSAAIAEMMASAQAMGLTVDASMVESAKRARDAQDQLNDSLTGLSNKIGSAVLPAVASFVEQLNQEVSALERGQQVKNYVIQTYGELEYVVASATGQLGKYAVEMDKASEAEVGLGQSAAGATGAVAGLGRTTLLAASQARAASAAFWDAAGRFHSGAAIIEGARARAASERQAVAAANTWASVTQRYSRAAAETANAVQRSAQANRGATDAMYAHALATQRGTTAAELSRAALARQASEFGALTGSAGGASAAIKQVTDETQQLIDRTNALKGALSQSIKPMDTGEQLQTAYALATGEVTVAQFEQQQAVKALLTALENQALTQEQVLTTVIGMREGVLSSADAFTAAGESGGTARAEFDKVVGTAATATTRIQDLSKELKNLPKNTPVNVKAVISGLDDAKTLKSTIQDLHDRQVTITVTTRYVTVNDTGGGGGGGGGDDEFDGTSNFNGGGGKGTGGGGGKDKNGHSGVAVVATSPVTIHENNPRRTAAYVARSQRQAARQAALRAQAGFMG